MTSVLSSYRQRETKGSYFITTGNTFMYTVPTISATVYLTSAQTTTGSGGTPASGAIAPASGEDLPDESAKNPVVMSLVPGGPVLSGNILKDLGREIDIYFNNAASGTITSPYKKIAVWRQVAVLANGYLGASGWIKVWSNTNVAVAPVARAAF